MRDLHTEELQQATRGGRKYGGRALRVRLSALAAAMLCVGAVAAHAEETQCTGTIGAVRLDNVFVPDGRACTLNRTRLNGNIVVGRGAQLTAQGVSVNGSVQAEGAASVALLNFSTVGGSVQIVQGRAATIDRARINGDLYFDSNDGRIDATANQVGGNLQAFQNEGGVRLVNNRIKGNLQCKENVPAPTGSGNQASSKEDQCERL